MLNPSDINLSTLPRVPLTDRRNLPTTSGIYFAIANGEVQYIGRSVNIRQRWADHHRAGQLRADTHIVYLEVSDLSLLPEIETALIEWFDPKLNGTRLWNWLERKKKPDSTKRTFRFNNINLEMLRIFADRNCLDMTSALNMLLNQNLSALGLKEEAQRNLEATAETYQGDK